jgi:hypothetical protein
LDRQALSVQIADQRWKPERKEIRITACRFGHNFNAEFRENGAAALAMLEAREVYQHGEDPVLTLEVGLEVISMGSVLMAVFILD